MINFGHAVFRVLEKNLDRNVIKLQLVDGDVDSVNGNVRIFLIGNAWTWKIWWQKE